MNAGEFSVVVQGNILGTNAHIQSSQEQLPSCKDNFLVTAEGEAPFNSEVVQKHPPLPHPSAQVLAVTAARIIEENVFINQALWKSIGNSNLSLNNIIFTTVLNRGRNLAGADASELCALGLELENEVPLPENLPNFGTMNWAAEVGGNWITPTICPHAQENCCSTNGKFSLMSWEIVAKADELELFKVRFDCIISFLLNEITD